MLSIATDRTISRVPRRLRQPPHTPKDGQRARPVGRAAPVLDDLQVTLIPGLPKENSQPELVAVERLLGPTFLDLLAIKFDDSK